MNWTVQAVFYRIKKLNTELCVPWPYMPSSHFREMTDIFKYNSNVLHYYWIISSFMIFIQTVSETGFGESAEKNCEFICLLATWRNALCGSETCPLCNLGNVKNRAVAEMRNQPSDGRVPPLAPWNTGATLWGPAQVHHEVQTWNMEFGHEMQP